MIHVLFMAACVLMALAGAIFALADSRSWIVLSALVYASGFLTMMMLMYTAPCVL